MTEQTSFPDGPDPSVLTTKQMLLGIENLEKLTAALRLGEVAVVGVKIEAIRREMTILETHRRELKADSETHRLELKAGDEKALSTAMIAAEKAVQAALAAAEKARDQQTIASQLATTKAENAFTEQLRQQKETFTIAIDAVTTGFNDMKGMMGELRAEKRGGQEVSTDRRAGTSQMIAIAAVGASLLGGVITAILVKLFGG